MSLNKYLGTPLKLRLSAAWASKRAVHTCLGRWSFFFILGYGRSGTAFLADLLNQAPGAYVFHEPVLEDFYAHWRAHYSAQAAEGYIRGFRSTAIYLRMRHTAPGIYGEVNSALRCHALAIRKTFAEPVLIHLVRDGRDVVRSTVPRRTMTIKNPFSLGLHPIRTDPWYSRWPEMDRFSRICWLWQEENRRLREAIGHMVQFEKLIFSYEYFETEVLQHCGIHIDRQTWQDAVSAPKNVTVRHQMPKWNEWLPSQQRTFKEICGEEMAMCGYVV